MHSSLAFRALLLHYPNVHLPFSFSLKNMCRRMSRLGKSSFSRDSLTLDGEPPEVGRSSGLQGTPSSGGSHLGRKLGRRFRRFPGLNLGKTRIGENRRVAGPRDRKEHRARRAEEAASAFSSGAAGAGGVRRPSE